MAQPIDLQGLRAAWRALAGGSGEGWRTIPIGAIGRARVLAGRHLPGNEEAVLVGFADGRLPPADQLPKGHGFLVTTVNLAPDGGGLDWVGLSRQEAGGLELFAMMVTDVVETLAELHGTDPASLPMAFISRIRAWQDFMQRGDDGVLGPEAEIGLMGELHVLRDLLGAGVAAGTVMNAWQGPMKGLHDFAFSSGAIEVKASIAPAGFPASIGSLDQLDDSKVNPLFLAAVRLGLSASGDTLPEWIAGTRALLEAELHARSLFESRLLHAGFLDRFTDRYSRRFVAAGTRIMRVAAGFPRLTSSTVPLQIRRARYDIDLDHVDTEHLPLNAALTHLGVI